MFLRTKGLITSRYITISKRLLSIKITDVLNTRLAPPSGTNEHDLQLTVVSKNLNALNLDLFVNNLNEHDDRTYSAIDLLANLRSTKLANTCLESTQFTVVRHMLENLTIQELVTVLLDRPKYGIFLNNFTGFAVAHTLHEQSEYALGLPLVLKLILAEETTCAFVQWFCLKASLEVLKKENSTDQNSEQLDKKPPPKKSKVQETKIRVKFIRNVTEYDIHWEMGKAILKIVPKILEGNAKDNAKILGLVLKKNYAELSEVLNKNPIEVCKDVADICKNLLTSANQMEIANKIGEKQTQSTFEDIVDKFLKETSDKEADVVAKEQKLLFPIWETQRAQLQLEIENELDKKNRKENIEELTNEITTKKELLWFFDQEDKIDLEIFKKQNKFYPKKWFGKKKKPRVVDENYVPPQIRRIN